MGWAWFIVNIVLPAGFPIIGVSLLRATTPRAANVERSKFRLMNVLKDGQLGWIAAAIASSSLYDFLDVISYCLDHDQRQIKLKWFIALAPIVFSVLVGVFSGAQGAVYVTETPAQPHSKLLSWIEFYQTFVVSFVATIVSATTWTVIHFTLTPLTQQIVTAGGK